MLTRIRPAPSQVSQRPPFTFVEKCRFAKPGRAAPRASTANRLADRVEDAEDRGRRYSTRPPASGSRSAATTREKRLVRRVTTGSAVGGVGALASAPGASDVEQQRGLAAARHAGDGDEPAGGDLHVEAAQVVAAGVRAR